MWAIVRRHESLSLSSVTHFVAHPSSHFAYIFSRTLLTNQITVHRGFCAISFSFAMPPLGEEEETEEEKVAGEEGLAEESSFWRWSRGSIFPSQVAMPQNINRRIRGIVARIRTQEEYHRQVRYASGDLRIKKNSVKKDKKEECVESFYVLNKSKGKSRSE